MRINGLDDSMDAIAALPADDAVDAMRRLLDIVNGIPEFTYAQRLTIMRAVCASLNAAVGRRVLRKRDPGERLQ
jgi:hypothetical protein